MARILIHYDVCDEAFRDQFQKAITAEDFSPRFSVQTKSVYVATVNATEAEIEKLRGALRRELANAPSGTVVFMERSGSTGNSPDIIQEKIHPQ